jgi:transitional endoplasmic reticulum ATPase
VRQKGKGFDDIAGMHDLKETLYHDVILPLTEKELYEQYKVSVPNGMLLYGPPGCGKTYIAKKFAEEIGYHFIIVNPSDMASTYIHGTQEKIGKLFKQAKDKAPTIILIDEADAILPKREGDLQHGYASEVNEFLAQMTECGKNGIFIIAATNRPDKIDPTVTRTGRLDKVVYLSPPDRTAREEMLQLHLKDRPMETIDIGRIAELTENYVSSDIGFLINEAARDALKERSKISQRHLENVIQRHLPSVSVKQIKQYERFKHIRSFD